MRLLRGKPLNIPIPKEGELLRKRYKRVEIHLTEEEHRHLKKQVSYTGLSTESFIRSLIMGLTLYPRPPDEYAEIRRQLAAIGNNINQIARTVNARGFASGDDIAAITAAQETIWNIAERL